MDLPPIATPLKQVDDAGILFLFGVSLYSQVRPLRSPHKKTRIRHSAGEFD